MRYARPIFHLLAFALLMAAPQRSRAEAVSPPGIGPNKTVLDFGAVGDGQADDTAAIEKAVAARIGDVWLPRGTYRTTRPIAIDLAQVGPTSLVGSGAATIVVCGPGPAIKLVGAHKGTADPGSVQPAVWQQRAPMVDGLEIVGQHEQAGGIEASGTMQLTITRTVIRKVLHAIHLTGRNRNVIIANCHLYENRGVGVFYDNVNLHQSNITGCHVSYNGAGGIVCRDGNVRNIHVAGCDIEANMDPKGPPAANILIDCSGNGAGTAEVSVTGCTIQHSDVPGSANIRYLGADAKDRRWGHFTITGNVLSDVEWNIDLQKARGVTIVGNTFWMGFAGDLRAEDSSNVVVGVNTFDRNPAYRYGRSLQAKGGVVFRNCQDCSLTGLHLNGVQDTAAGLILEQCRRFHVAQCTILDCRNAGVLLDRVADSRLAGCLIRNDVAGDQPWSAINIVGGKDNVIEHSTAARARGAQ